MPYTILNTDQPNTPDDDILGKDWYGEFQLACILYGSDPVRLQFRDPGETWLNARFNGTVIQLQAQGDVLDVKLVKDRDYRLITANPGAKVTISKHDPHD